MSDYGSNGRNCGAGTAEANVTSIERENVSENATTKGTESVQMQDSDATTTQHWAEGGVVWGYNNSNNNLQRKERDLTETSNTLRNK